MRHLTMQFRPTFWYWLLLVALMVPVSIQAETWQVAAGAQSEDKARQVLAFLPNEIWIHAGDIVNWTVGADEIHTVTFLTVGDLLAELDHAPSHHHSGAPNGVVVGVGKTLANGGGHDTISLMRFVQPELVIHAGATVEWTNDDPSMPHTITFGTEPGNPIPPSSNVSPDAGGALHATINSTSDSVHSGFIVSAPQDQAFLPQTPLGFTRFRVTFTNPGVYPYICALHDDLGMKGIIIVLP